MLQGVDVIIRTSELNMKFDVQKAYMLWSGVLAI